MQYKPTCEPASHPCGFSHIQQPEHSLATIRGYKYFFSSALRGGKTINNSEKARGGSGGRGDRAGGRHTSLSREINEKKSGLAERNSAADRGRDAFVRSAGRKKIQ